jgi:hypothetical protein
MLGVTLTACGLVTAAVLWLVIAMDGLLMVSLGGTPA